MTPTSQDLALLRRRQAGVVPSSRAPKPRPRRERDIQRAILDFLKTVPGVVAWKSGGGLLTLADGRRVRMGHKGVSDLIGWQCQDLGVDDDGNWCSVHVARFLAIEVKRPGARATEEQMAFLDAVVRAGGIALIASSVEEVARALGQNVKEAQR